tara:strand:- start:5830 stop:5994 length:165 start_codon:yes stop_codon:yes gene_type:complete
MHEAGNIASDNVPTGEPVDLFITKPKEQVLRQYFMSSAPFYQYTWGKNCQHFLV